MHGPDPVVSRVVRGPAAEVWRAWTEPSRFALWFGDCDGPLDRPGARVRIDFGDGDFFDAVVEQARSPESLSLRWRLLGIGDLDSVSVRIEPALPDPESRTVAVVVSDSGLLGPDGDGLREGWRDFLDRLERHMPTGENTRYDWSPAIAFGFTLAHGEQDPAGRLTRAVVELAVERGLTGPAERTTGRAALLVDHPGDAGHTEARIRVGDTGRVDVEHAGFDALRLPPPERIAARRDWVRLWLAAIDRS